MIADFRVIETKSRFCISKKKTTTTKIKVRTETEIFEKKGNEKKNQNKIYIYMCVRKLAFVIVCYFCIVKYIHIHIYTHYT